MVTTLVVFAFATILFINSVFPWFWYIYFSSFVFFSFVFMLCFSLFLFLLLLLVFLLFFLLCDLHLVLFYALWLFLLFYYSVFLLFFFCLAFVFVLLFRFLLLSPSRDIVILSSFPCRCKLGFFHAVQCLPRGLEDDVKAHQRRWSCQELPAPDPSSHRISAQQAQSVRLRRDHH